MLLNKEAQDLICGPSEQSFNQLTLNIAKMPEITEFSSLLSTKHGRERRLERNIEKIDLQNAKKYGMAERAIKRRMKYTYGGIVFIYDPIRKREITSFPSRDAASDKTGTRCQKPLILKKNKAYEKPMYIDHHDLVKAIIKNEKTKWKSHAVFIIDMSGSMRQDDVSGAKCRSDGVWLVLARDFVKKQLDNNTASDYDVVTMIVMRDIAELVFEFEPLDWILYNKLIDMREWMVCRPNGPGNYLPALDMAATLLAENNLGTCALSLLFFSDGKPSDHGLFAEKMGEIASKYRRRLTFCCVAIAGDTDEDEFRILKAMVTEADAFGANSSFKLPLLDTKSLSHIISSISSSLTATKTEMTDLATGETRVVRHDIKSERKGTKDDLHPTDEWNLYIRKGLQRIWSWSSSMDDFVLVRDPRCLFCLEDCVDSVGIVPADAWCPSCKAVTFCEGCGQKNQSHVDSKLCLRSQEMYRSGKIVDYANTVPSFSVAMKETIFGEGAERIVRKLRYLDKNNNFIGPKMVAKESRFIDPTGSTYNVKRAFHANFMRTQALAAEFATKFNVALDSLHFRSSPQFVECIKDLPRIEFVQPMVVQVKGSDEEEWKSILIEKFLEGDYEKFNNNMGFVKGQDLKNSLYDNMNPPAEAVDIRAQIVNLGIIEEGSEEDFNDDGDDDLIGHKMFEPSPGEYLDVQDCMIPQTFSHFSFAMSKQCLMVVDLQGVFQVNADGTRKYLLTDPAIHKNDRKRRNHKLDFGRTDRGKKGMKAFFETHECTDACRLLGLPTIDPKIFDQEIEKRVLGIFPSDTN